MRLQVLLRNLVLKWMKQQSMEILRFSALEPTNAYFHRFVVSLWLRPIGAEQAVPPWKIKAEVAVCFLNDN